MDRQAFFDRIRTRLGRPRLAHAPARDVIGMPRTIEIQPLSSKPPPANPVLAFKSELERVGGVAEIADDLESARAALRAELDRWGAARIVSWARSEFAGWDLDWLWTERGARAWSEPPLDGEAALKRALLDAEIGVTTVDYAISATGSLVLSASATRPRGVSLLPAVHVALVRASQILPRMGDALEPFGSRGAAAMPSALYFVSGPSRTSDIENDLTIGVHGPAAVSVVIWRDHERAGGAGS